MPLPQEPLTRLERIGATIRCDNEGQVREAILSGLLEANDEDLAGLSHFGCLRNLYLDDTAISSAGLPEVGRTRSLETLFLTDCKRVDDLGMAHLASLHRMVELDLSGTSISDFGLQHLAEMRQLEKLYLKRTKVTDRGLSYVSERVNLKHLSLIKTKITDNGLNALRHLIQLERLELVSTAVTDHAVDILKCLANLKFLYIQATQITENGATALAGALPNAEIWHPAL